MKKSDIPLTGLAGLKAHYKDDLLAGFGVSLIALPLSLGVAMASGVPPLAGMITAIIGGLIASRIGGTFVTISGPAAGLIVVTYGAVEVMGYANALGAILIAGAIMVLFGFLKVGKLGDYFPSAAVRGMLAAIGFIIIIKQLYPSFGLAAPKEELLTLAAMVPESIGNANSIAVFVSLITIAILFIHPLINFRPIRFIPAPMWVLIATIPLTATVWSGQVEMIELPHRIFGKEGIQLPSFGMIGESFFWTSVLAFALVSSLETMLSAKAIDKLDPYKRTSDLNKDLIAMGTGSTIASVIGGLPMISAIVRSSANLNNGAKTQWSNFFHGVFILLYLLIGVSVIEMIPIAALAAMLVYTGFKLASPKMFRLMFRIGMLEFLVFIVTIVAVLATDILVGIAIGLLLNYLLILRRGVKLKSLFVSTVDPQLLDSKRIFYMHGVHFFSNYLSLKKKLDKGFLVFNEVVLDFSSVVYVDHTVLEHLYEYKRKAASNGQTLTLLNLDQLESVSSHPMSSRKKK